MRKGDIISILRPLVEKLSSKDYIAVYSNDKLKRLSIEEIKNAIESYKGRIIIPPTLAFENLFIYGNEEDSEHFVEFNLWYNDRESDLTLSATIYNTNEYSIEDIHVL